jgi:hypothetical protein
MYPEITGSPLVLFELEKRTVTMFRASASCTRLDWFFQMNEGFPMKPTRSGIISCNWKGRTDRRAGAM